MKKGGTENRAIRAIAFVVGAVVFTAIGALIVSGAVALIVALWRFILG